MKISSPMARILTLLACVASVFGQAGGNPGQDLVVAEVDGEKLTLTQFEQGMAARLFQARQQYYLAQRAALEQWIDDQVLANEARRQKITVKELLDRNIQVTDPTDDQMRVYYEGVNTDQPYEVVREKVLKHIRDLRSSKIRAAYVKSLREKAGAMISFAAPAAAFDPGTGFVLGARDAQVRLVEFADYECAYCQQAHPIIKRLVAEYGSKISFAFRDFPLPMHPQAVKAAEAARCAGSQGKFWEYHDALFNDRKFAISDLKETARKLPLDAAVFDRCLDSGEQAPAVAKDTSEAQRLQLSGTPTFFINGRLFTGALTYGELASAIDKELALGSSNKVARK